MEAEKWLSDQNPTIDDIIVVVGHSYGGNRAYLFVNQIKTTFGLNTALLATIDAVDWKYCDAEGILFLNQSFGLCDQTNLVEAQTPALSAISFYQTLGESIFPLTGYSVPGSVRVQRPDQHTTIDEDSIVQQTIRTMMANLVRGPQAAIITGTPARTSSGLSVPITVSVTGFGEATGVTITAASLNGVPATNLAAVSTLGNISAGGSSGIINVAFPGTSATSGANVMFTTNGTYSSGQTFTNTARIKVP